MLRIILPESHLGITDEIRSSLVSQGHPLAKIEKLMNCLAGDGNVRLTLREARDLRSAVFEVKLAAKRNGREAASLDKLYNTLTTAMRNRAIDLGMVEDWDRAETASRALDQDRELVGPLLSTPAGQDGVIAFQKAWRDRTPEMRAALRHLEEHAGLDLKSLEAGSRWTEALLRNLEVSKRTTWFERKPQLVVLLILVIAAVWWGIAWRDPLPFAAALGTMAFIDGCILWGPAVRLRAKARALELIAAYDRVPHA